MIGDGTPDEVLTDAAAASAYGVSLARTAVEGEMLVAPWRRIARGAEGGG